MSIAILTLTDTDEIRSALGVDDKDIADALITNLNPEVDLQADLMTWVPTYQTIISEGAAGTPTDEQTLKYLKLKLYAKYFISAIFASSGGNSILQKLSDGSNEGTRFTNVSLAKLQLDLQGRADGAKAALELLITPTTGASYSHFGTVQPAYDPVTNTET